VEASKKLLSKKQGKKNAVCALGLILRLKGRGYGTAVC